MVSFLAMTHPDPAVRTLQRAHTSLAPQEVLVAAKKFFLRQNSIYPAFLEKEGSTFVTFRGQGGEEIALGVVSETGGTVVTGSTYMFDQQIARFFATLPPVTNTLGREVMTEVVA